MTNDNEQAQPILVIRERDSSAVCSYLVKQKGAVDEYIVKRAMAFIKELSYSGTKIIIKSDQESSIQAVVNKIMQTRADQPTINEYSPLKSSGNNGIIERTVNEVENQIRAMKSALD